VGTSEGGFAVNGEWEDVQCASCRVPVERPTIWGTLGCGWCCVQGLNGGGQADEFWLCPGCRGLLAVGFDWSQAQGNQPLLSESVACAFAFHLGQYDAAARAQGWETDASTGRQHHRDWRSETFTAPETLGQHGWGRWSQVRRDADTDGGIPVPAKFVDQLQQAIADGVAQTPARDLISARPHDPRRMRELMTMSSLSADDAELIMDHEARLGRRFESVRRRPGAGLLCELNDGVICEIWKLR
jgi:hypothetical protein